MRKPRIGIIIATLNEAPTIKKVVQNIPKKIDDCHVDIIVVDGFSTDGTIEIATQLGVKVLFQKGQGKGSALRTAFENLDYDVYVTIDGDMTYDPQEITKLVKPIIDGDADMVIGSRMLGKRAKGSMSVINTIGNYFFNFLLRHLHGIRISDSQTGYRAISKKLLNKMPLKAASFDIETELTVFAAKLGRIKEVPISYYTRTGSPTKLRAFSDGMTIFSRILDLKVNSPFPS
jgi:glycosyltransferase involved in cell wall biosynthesis